MYKETLPLDIVCGYYNACIYLYSNIIYKDYQAVSHIHQCVRIDHHANGLCFYWGILRVHSERYCCGRGHHPNFFHVLGFKG